MDANETSFSTSNFKRALEDYRNELFTIYHLMVMLATEMHLLPDPRYANDAARLDSLAPEAFSALLNRARHYSIFENRQTENKNRIRPFPRRYLHPASCEVVQGKEQRQALIASMRSNKNSLEKLRAKVRELNRTESAVHFKRAFNEALKLTGLSHGLFRDPPEINEAQQKSKTKMGPFFLNASTPFLTTPAMKKELARFGLSPEKMLSRPRSGSTNFHQLPPHLRPKAGS